MMMKEKLIIILMVVMTFNMTSALAQHSVEGSWQLAAGEVEMEMLDTSNKGFNSLPDDKRRTIIEEIGDRKFVFAAGGGFNAQWLFQGETHALNGDWSLDRNILTIKSEAEDRQYEIEFLTENRLILIPLKRMGLLVKLIFDKSKNQ